MGEWTCKWAENGNAQVKYLKIVLKNFTWVNHTQLYSITGYCKIWHQNFDIYCIIILVLDNCISTGPEKTLLISP